RNTQEFRRILDRKPAKITQLYYTALLGIELGQTIQSFVQRHQVNVVTLRTSFADAGIERKPCNAGSPLRGATTALVGHQNPTHERRSNAEKMRAILDVERILFRKPEKGLVDQTGRLQRVIRSLMPKLLSG